MPGRNRGRPGSNGLPEWPQLREKELRLRTAAKVRFAWAFVGLFAFSAMATLISGLVTSDWTGFDKVMVALGVPVGWVLRWLFTEG